MKKNKCRKLTVTFLSVAALLVGSLAVQNQQPIQANAFYATEQSGITVHKNFKLETATNENYRKFAIAERYDASVSTSKYTAYRSFAGNGEAPIDFAAGGVLIEAEAYGETSTVRLFDALSGQIGATTIKTNDSFSIIAQPIMETLYDDTWKSTSEQRDYQTLSFTFNDLDSDNWISVHLQGTSYGTTYVTITANNNGTEISTDAKSVRNVSNVAFFGPAQYLDTVRNVPTVLRFDPANPKIVNLTHKAESNYLDFTVTNATALPVMERYSVDMTFGMKNQANTAKLMVYEICKQSMAGAKITDTTAPTVSQIFAPSDMVKGYPYEITASAFDLIEGTLSGKAIDIAVTDANDTPIAANNGKWTFETAGEYTVTATPKDSAGNVGKSYQKTITVVENDTAKPSIAINGNYNTAYFVGNPISVYTAEYTDNTGIATSSVSVEKDDVPVTVTGNAFTPVDAGDYKVIYRATDAAGNEQIQEISFLVFGFGMPQTLNVPYSPNPTLIAQPTGIPVGWYYTVNLYKAEDTQKAQPLPIVNDAYAYTGGEYVLEYCLYSADSDIPVGTSEVRITAEFDTVKPDMLLNGEYESTYTFNQSLVLLDMTVTDNSNVCTLEVKAYCGENEVAIQDNAITLDKAGTYKVIYVATDANGNSDSLEYTFTVEQPVSNGCGGNVAVSSVIMAMFAFATVAFCKRKEN